MDIQFAWNNGRETRTKPRSQRVEMVDGTRLNSGSITQETLPIRIAIADQEERIEVDLISSVHCQIILGMPWRYSTTRRSPGTAREIRFASRACRTNVISLFIDLWF